MKGKWIAAAALAAAWASCDSTGMAGGAAADADASKEWDCDEDPPPELGPYSKVEIHFVHVPSSGELFLHIDRPHALYGRGIIYPVAGKDVSLSETLAADEELRADYFLRSEPPRSPLWSRRIGHPLESTLSIDLGAALGGKDVTLDEQK